MQEKVLLHDSGGQFELALLLTQIEALNYASNLAKVAGENDSQSVRVRYLAGLSEEMKDLREKAIMQLSLRQLSTAGAQ